MPVLPASPEAARRAAEVLASGGVAVLPAEGVYGLTALASRPDALARIRQLKGRGVSQPLLSLVSHWRHAAAWVATPEALDRLDGLAGLAVTVLLPASPEAPPRLVGPDRLVGLRVPADRFGTTLVEASVGPVASTSANPSGDPSPAAFGEIDPVLVRRVDVAVDGGPLAGRASTIVSIEGDAFSVIREGAVAPEAIAMATGLWRS